MLRVVHAFDPDTGAELARLSSTIQPNIPQLSDVQMVSAGRADFVRLHSLSHADAERARYEVREDHEPTVGDPPDSVISKSQDNDNAAS